MSVKPPQASGAYALQIVRHASGVTTRYPAVDDGLLSASQAVGAELIPRKAEGLRQAQCEHAPGGASWKGRVMKEVATTKPQAALTPFAAFRREMDRLFEDFGATTLGRAPFAFNGLLAPEIDYAETGDSIVISTELSGVDQKDVEISLDDDVLTIRGEKKSSRDEKKENYRVAERSFGSFERRVSLPAGVDADQAKAEFGNGVLKITLPKPDHASAATKKIAIKAS
jgi:HSP20 family protein